MKRIEYENGVKEETFYDPLTNELHIKRTEDIQNNLEFAQQLRNDDQATRDGIKDGMWHYGHIPNMILAQWAQQGVNVNDTKELIRMLNKPENSHLKTTRKHHS